MHYARKAGVLLAGALLFSLPSVATAQEDPDKGHVWVAARGGIAVPVAGMADITKIGGSADLAIAYAFNRVWSVYADVGAQFMPSKTTNGVALTSAFNLYSGQIGVQVDFKQYDDSTIPMSFAVNVAGGAARWEGDSNSSLAGSTIASTVPMVSGGAIIGYDVSPKVNIFAEGQFFLLFTKSEDMAVFTSGASPITDRSLSPAFMVPVTLGVRYNF